MAIYADRVKETTTTSGTGTVTLAGAVAGFQAFSVFATGTRVRYCIVDGNAWEVGDGVYTTSGTTLSRLNVYASSNSNALVSLSGGTSIVFCDLPALAVADLGLTLATNLLMIPQ